LIYNLIAQDLLLTKDNDSLHADQLIKVARNFYRLNSWQSLKTTSQISLARSLDRKDEYFVGQSYRWLGVYNVNISLNDSAFYFFLKAKKIFEKQKKQKELSEIYINTSLVQYYANDYLGSQISAINALKIAQKHKYIDQVYDGYIQLEMSLREIQDYKSAIEYCFKTIEFVKRNSKFFNSQDEAFLYRMIGHNYKLQGKINEALRYYKIALQKNNNSFIYPSFYCRLLDDYGETKLILGKYENLEDLFFQVNRIRDSLNIEQGKNYNNLFLSRYYQATNQISKAQQFAHEAYSLSKGYRNAGDMLQCLKQLVKVEPQNALKYSQEYIRISDSMQQLERQTRNKFAKIAYETEEITTEKDQAIQQKWIFFGVAVLVFTIGGLVILLLIQRAKQKELRFLQEQQKTNEEIYQLIQNQQTKIDEARQKEKKRIAQDLHDGIMNRLSSTRLNLHILNENATPEIIKKCLPFIAGIQDIEKEIRSISHDLNKDAIFNKVSFVAVLEAFIEEQKPFFSGKCHLEIERNINWEWLSTFQKIHIFRMLQEAFQNTVKHAQAKNIIISILKNENQLLLEIFDDGIGFSFKQKKKGIGLQNIFSRAKQCHGKAEINSEVGTGTTIRITIPLSPKL
jgi:signal transduction histidine kinase